MKVSRNELKTALMRAYEGVAYDTGDFEDYAELATWSVMCGLEEIKSSDFPLQGPVQLQPLLESAGCAVIDAQGANPGQTGMLAVHLAASLVQKNGFANVNVLRSSRPGLILAAMNKLAIKGFNFSVYWREGDQQHGASLLAGEDFPSYWCVQDSHSNSAGVLADIYILCSAQPGLLASWVGASAIDPDLQRVAWSQAQLESNYDKSLNDGIEIDDEAWQLLNQAAWPILVAATDQSRTGAGPG